jgi:hypothetical protein
MAIAGQPAYFRRRISRPHPFDEDGRQVLAPSLDGLTATERKRVPRSLARLAQTFREVIAAAPAPFEWLREAMSDHGPIVECSTFDDREYWHLRWSAPFRDSLAVPCFGVDANPRGPAPAAVPQPLAWLRETFGTIGLIAEQSGTAPFGRTFAEIVTEEREAQATIRASLAQHPGFETAEPWHDRFAGFPPEATDWVSLYERDGDWVFADVARGATVWVGAEWTGSPESRFAVPWTRAASFILWRMLDGGYVRPIDLRMLL